MLRLEKEKDKLTAYLSGELDHHASRLIREELDESLRCSLPKKLVLDFSGITFMDSSGIGLIMGRYKLIKSMDGEIEVRGAKPQIRRVMQLSGLFQLVTITEEDEQE